ncbi:hypothetical protein Q3G72_023742 [Acer saccharum]|nr:hypothetical protein Q3G72_023742 [Acer saccharum]
MLHEAWEDFGLILSITKSPRVRVARQSPPSRRHELANITVTLCGGTCPAFQKQQTSQDDTNGMPCSSLEENLYVSGLGHFEWIRILDELKYHV